MPPLPVARKRPDQFSGSQASKVIFDRLDVCIERAIRQTLAGTSCFARLQLGTLSGKVSVVLAATYSSTFRVAFGTSFSGSNARHLFSKVDPAMGDESARTSKGITAGSMMTGQLHALFRKVSSAYKSQEVHHEVRKEHRAEDEVIHSAFPFPACGTPHDTGQAAPWRGRNEHRAAIQRETIISHLRLKQVANGDISRWHYLGDRRSTEMRHFCL